MSDGSCDGGGENDSTDGECKEEEVTMEANGGVTSLDEVFACLTSSRRRFVLYYLQDNEIVDVDELATEIAAWEAETRPDDVPTDHQERVTIELVHTHLPKLAAVQFIEYDRRTSTVRYTEPPTLLNRVLRLLGQLERESDG